MRHQQLLRCDVMLRIIQMTPLAEAWPEVNVGKGANIDGQSHEPPKWGLGARSPEKNLDF